MKSRFLLENNLVNDLINILTKEYSLPVIREVLVVYSTDNKYTFEFCFHNNQAFFKFFKNNNNNNDEGDLYKNDRQYISLDAGKLDYFLKMISVFGFNDIKINHSIRFEFYKENEMCFAIHKNTLIGDIFYIFSDTSSTKSIGRFCKKLITKSLIDDVIKDKKIKNQKIFSDLGIINSQISDFANKYGMNIFSSPSSISLKLGAKSNDYSLLQDQFHQIFNRDLCNDLVADIDEERLGNVSVIIPSWNSERSITDVLLAIQSQNLSRNFIKNIEVIIVDDGSDNNLYEALNRNKSTYIFELKIIRSEKNSGLSSARNLGLYASKNDKLIFIDSDILLTENYIREHLIRMNVIPNAIFFSLKKNIDINDMCIKNIRKGLKCPLKYNDKRLKRSFVSNSDWVNEVESDGDFEILNETNNLKFLGNGRLLNGFDLPSAVVGHNFSIKKEHLLKIGGFSNEFNGWGLEDCYMGAKIIASGNFVIPVLSVGVYHINHTPRSGSKELQQQEYKKNISKYKKLINQKL